MTRMQCNNAVFAALCQGLWMAYGLLNSATEHERLQCMVRGQYDLLPYTTDHFLSHLNVFLSGGASALSDHERPKYELILEKLSDELLAVKDRLMLDGTCAHSCPESSTQFIGPLSLSQKCRMVLWRVIHRCKSGSDMGGSQGVYLQCHQVSYSELVVSVTKYVSLTSVQIMMHMTFCISHR